MYIKKRIAAGLIVSLILFAGMTATVLAFTTVLAFRTPATGVSIPLGATQLVTNMDISAFRKIRVVAKERGGSPTNARINLIILDNNGGPIGSLDPIDLTPGNAATRVYEVPGTSLRITASATFGGPPAVDIVDVFVFGSD